MATSIGAGGFVPRDTDELILGDNTLDMTQAALSNLYGFDVQGAARSLSDPNSLSPEERKKLSTRLGLGGTFASSVVDITTHPMVLLGAILTFAFPRPTAQALQIAKEGLNRAAHSLVPFLEKLGPLSWVYRDTTIPADFDLLQSRFVGFAQKSAEKMTTAFREFEKATGQSRLTKDQSLRIGAYLDRLWEPSGRPQWAILRDFVGQESKSAYSREEAAKLLGILDDPLPDFHLTKAEVELAGGIRGFFDDSWKELFSSKENRRAVLESILGHYGNGPVTKMTDQQVDDFAKYLKDYWPHMAKISPAQRAEALRESLPRWVQEYDPIVRTQGEEFEKSVRGLAKSAKDRGISRKRTWARMPDVEHLRQLGARPEVVEAVERYQRWSSSLEGTHRFSRYGYSLSLDEVIPQYMGAAARTFAWNLPTAPGASPIGERIAKWIRENLARGEVDAAKARELQNIYVPMALGRYTKNQVGWAAHWETQKRSLFEALETDVAKKAIPQGVRKWVQEGLLGDQTSSYPLAGQQISGYLHATTLGGNFVSAARNALQTLATLIPTIGLKNTIHGYRRFTDGLWKYLDDVVSHGADRTKAMASAWPEFAEKHLELGSVAHQEMAELLQHIEHHTLNSLGGKLRSKWRVLSSWLTSPFAATETMNRVAAFYGSQRMALTDYAAGGGRIYSAALERFREVPRSGRGLREAANQFAFENTMRTQFGSGMEQRPSLVADWWSPWRQYTTFPLRMTNFLLGEAVRNPGVMGRTLLGAGLAYGVGREALNADLYSSIVFGGLPDIQEDSPFAPLPLVSPALQLVGSAAMGLTGNTEALQRALPLVVPGGVAATRFIGLIPGVGGLGGRLLNKSYADYEGQLPDGRVPVFGPNQVLQGYYTPAQLVGRAVGLGNTLPNQERELASMLLSNRDRIREMKKDMLQALSEGDLMHFQRLQAEWTRAYPGFGPLPISKSDIRALHVRQHVGRLERIMDTLPPQLKPTFNMAVSTSLGANFESMWGFISKPPEEANTINLREPYRAVRRGQVEAQVGSSLHGKKLRDRLAEQGMYRQGQQSIVGSSPLVNLTFGG